MHLCALEPHIYPRIHRCNYTPDIVINKLSVVIVPCPKHTAFLPKKDSGILIGKVLARGKLHYFSEWNFRDFSNILFPICDVFADSVLAEALRVASNAISCW